MKRDFDDESAHEMEDKHFEQAKPGLNGCTDGQKRDGKGLAREFWSIGVVPEVENLSGKFGKVDTLALGRWCQRRMRGYGD